MIDIPREVLSDHFSDRLSGLRPVAAVFFTYQFEPGFFEKEMLPVLFDIPVGHAAPVRLLRLEEELRQIQGRVAVYYDHNGLVASDAGSCELDVRRVPLVRATGVFHAKNVFLLCEERDPDEAGQRERKLLVGCLSANLTRAGWWENVEVCHVEEIEANDRTRIREDLLGLLNLVHRMTPAGTDQSALEEIRRFLRYGTGSIQHKSGRGTLHPHLYVGDTEDVVEFLERMAGPRLQGCYLEVISPYFDKYKRCEPLERLIDTFDVNETRVMLPREADGAATISDQLYESVAALRNVSWSHLPDEVVRMGRSSEAADRFVHAKVYRFFHRHPKFELLLVGSVNLTQAAHRPGGNLEAAFLFEHEPARRPEFWLVPDERRPREFAPKTEGEDAATHRGVPLVVRYTWNTGRAEVWWNAERPSPALRLHASGIEVAVVPVLPPREWVALADEDAQRLRDVLASTSFLEVHGHGKEAALVLVQEEGMSHKPSLVLRLSAKEILEYWALFTEEQKQDFLEHRYAEIHAQAGAEHLLAPQAPDLERDTFFDRFAGIFHSFSCLERAIAAAFEQGNEREVECRLFGQKHDSLVRLLERVLDTDDFDDPVNRYVVLMCALQLRREVARDHADFWREHGSDVAALDRLLGRATEIRSRLEERDPAGMGAFLAWFDEVFLARAEVPEPVESR